MCNANFPLYVVSAAFHHSHLYLASSLTSYALELEVCITITKLGARLSRARGGWPWLTFHNQVSLKSHDIFNLKSILHVIDDNEPLSIANAIEKEFKILPVFPWPITSKTDLQGRKIITGINF